jgi:hypothetical protein
MAHGQDRCEVSVAIPLNPTEPWMANVIGVELDETIEQTAQVALTSLFENRLTYIAVMLIVLFPIRNQDDPVWKQCLEAVSDSLPHWHGYIGRVHTTHVQLVGQHHQDHHPAAFALGLA